MARFVDAYLLAQAYLDVAREEHLTGFVFLSPEVVANTILKLSEKLENVEPVVHAQWIENDEFPCYNCSNCHDAISYSDFNDYEYCPHCGAKMDEEVE